jgi:hypothetical protein
MQLASRDGSVMVCGVLPKDAEHKLAGEKNSHLTRFSVKVGEKPAAAEGEKPEAIWCYCVCWHNVAKAAAEFKKMDVVLAVGKIKTREYEGKTYKDLECEFVSRMPVPIVPTAEAVSSASVVADVGALDGYEEIYTNGDLPF